MTTDDKKPNPQTPAETPVDLLPEPEGLSEDPFSEDYEATVIEVAAKVAPPDDSDAGEETTEVTQRTAIESPFAKDEKPAAEKHFAPVAKQKSTMERPKKSIWPQIALGGAVALGMILLLGMIYAYNHYTRPIQNPKQNLTHKIGLPADLLPPQDHDIQLSNLQLISTKPQKNNTPEVFLGDELNWEFALTHWQTPPNQNLNFDVELKIFGPAGLLVYDAPKFKTFSDLADASQEEIRVNTRVKALPQAALGVYRLRIDVIDKSSGQRKTLQTRFRVLSRVR